MNAGGERPAKGLSQSAFAKHRGVSKAVVTKWKGQGHIVLTADGLVDVEATEWNLDQRPATYRGGTAHRPIRVIPKDEPDPRETQPPSKASHTAPRPAEGFTEPDDDTTDDPDGTNLPTAEAIRRKENYLGLTRKQGYERDRRALVDRAAAEALFFATARDLRDSWLAWPARIAVVMADELGVDARLLTTVLTAHVNQHLAELGEPDPELH